MRRTMSKICFLFLCLTSFFFLSKDISAQEAYRDPFETRFPEGKDIEIRQENPEQQPVVVSVPLPRLVVTGVLCVKTGTSTAIVNDKVYRAGDIVEGTTVKIHKIEKDKVSVLFEGGVFELNIVRKDIGKKENR